MTATATGAITAVMLMVAAGAFAQSTQGAAAAPERWTVSGSIGGSVPIGPFGERVPDGAGLLRGTLERQLGDTPFSIGGEFGWLLFSESDSRVAGRTLTTTNDATSYAVIVRVRSSTGRWRPYAEAMFGGTTFSTHSKVKGSGFTVCGAGFLVPTCRTLGEEQWTDLSDTTTIYGPGVGIMRTLGGSGYLFDLSLRYTGGGRARYLREGAIQRDGEHVWMDVSQSRTDMVALNFGIAWVGRVRPG